MALVPAFAVLCGYNNCLLEKILDMEVWSHGSMSGPRGYLNSMVASANVLIVV